MGILHPVATPSGEQPRECPATPDPSKRAGNNSTAGGGEQNPETLSRDPLDFKHTSGTVTALREEHLLSECTA